jgi:hypothetical protein
MHSGDPTTLVVGTIATITGSAWVKDHPGQDRLYLVKPISDRTLRPFRTAALLAQPTARRRLPGRRPDTYASGPWWPMVDLPVASWRAWQRSWRLPKVDGCSFSRPGFPRGREGGHCPRPSARSRGFTALGSPRLGVRRRRAAYSGRRPHLLGQRSWRTPRHHCEVDRWHPAGDRRVRGAGGGIADCGRRVPHRRALREETCTCGSTAGSRCTAATMMRTTRAPDARCRDRDALAGWTDQRRRSTQRADLR